MSCKTLWNNIKTWLSTKNHLMWGSTIALIVIGLIGMYFIGPYEAAKYNFGQHIFFVKFWPFALIGTIVLFVCSKLSKKWVIRISWLLGIASLLLMMKTIVDPTIINGSARYVQLGSVLLNPFAIMLPPYIVLMSHWLNKDNEKKTWTTFGVILLNVFIIMAALQAPYVFMVQAYLLLFIIMTFKARKNCPGAFYTSMGILIAFAAMMGLAIWHYPHVQHKLINLGNYATQMSVHAITNSAFIGASSESLSTLSRLPNAISDFMFTGIIAKFGMLIGLLVLAFYGFIVKGLVNKIKTTKDLFYKGLATGTLWLFAVYIIMALTVAFGALATAAYWPFIGYGGTMLIMWCVLFGFVLTNKNTK